MSFHFKQFSIQQDRTAMKVTTDACLFGAWVANRLRAEGTLHLRVVDIGTGSGLLSLMVSQAVPCMVDAIEIDAAAAGQAKENFAATPWKDNLQVHHTSVQDFHPLHLYDIVISNPPFFQDNLRSSDPAKNAAKHHDSLDFRELIKAIDRLLEKDGSAFVLVPYPRLHDLESVARERSLFIQEKMLVRQTPGHGYFRAMLRLSTKEQEIVEGEITIHDQEKAYTREFVELLKEYYLYLD